MLLDYMSKEELENIVISFLQLKAYPEIPTDPEILNNATHPANLIEEIYGPDPESPDEIEKLLNRWGKQDEYKKQAIAGNEVKLKLAVRQLYFAEMLIFAGEDKESVRTRMKFEAVKLARQIRDQDHEFIKWVARVAKQHCKTKKEKIAFYREHLSGMEQYKELINAHFVNE